ncbi:MAG: hypothetical protein WAM88_09670 [Nitrososphaeraceae archaeon]
MAELGYLSIINNVSKNKIKNLISVSIIEKNELLEKYWEKEIEPQIRGGYLSPIKATELYYEYQYRLRQVST